MTGTVDIEWAAPLTDRDTDRDGAPAGLLASALHAGAVAALAGLGLPDLPVRIAEPSVTEDRAPQLVVCGLPAADPALAQRQAFGLCAGWSRAFPDTWEEQWEVLGELDRRADFARHWARLTIAGHPDSVAPAVIDQLGITDAAVDSNRYARSAVNYVFAHTPYSTAECRSAVRRTRFGSDDEVFRTLTATVAATANVLELRAGPDDIREVGRLLHTPVPTALATGLADYFRPTRACLLPRLVAVPDATVPEGFVEVGVGGRILRTIALPPRGSQISVEVADLVLHRPDRPDLPLGVTASDGPGNVEEYLDLVLTDVLLDRAPTLLSARSVGLLLNHLAAKWDADLVSSVRRDFTDEGVTLAVRTWVTRDQWLDALPVLLRELAAADPDSFMTRMEAALDATERRVAGA